MAKSTTADGSIIIRPYEGPRFYESDKVVTASELLELERRMEQDVKKNTEMV